MNSQKGFLSLLGLILVLAIMGGGAYFYTQSDLSLLKFNKLDESDPNATSTNGISDILNNTQSLVDEKNKGQCVENSDCRDSEICYFKPGGNIGACVAKMSNEKSSVQTNTNVQVGGSCLQDTDCATGMCYFEVGGRVGVCTGVKAESQISDSFFLKEFPDGKIMAKGDINGDGFEDAIVEEVHCGASCGIGLHIILNKGNKDTYAIVGKYASFEPLYRGSSAWKTALTSITIENGLIYLTGYGFDDTEIDTPESKVIRTLKFKLEGSETVHVL